MPPDQRRARISLITLLALLAGLCVAAGMGMSFLAHWVRSEECRVVLERKASELLGGQAEVGPLEWLWLGIASPKVRTVTGRGPLTRELDAGDVRARLRPSSLLKGVWAVEEISLGRTKLHVKAASYTPEQSPLRATSAPRPLLPFWIPSRFVIEVVRSGCTDLMFDLPEKKMLEVLETKLTAYPEEGGELRLEAEGGHMIWSRFPDFSPEIVRAKGRLSEGRLSLAGADLRLRGGGSLTLEGDFPDAEGISRIAAHVSAIPLPSLFPTASANLAGNVSGEGRATWRGSHLLTLEGRVVADGATVRGIPALAALADLTGMDRFRELTFRTASASFERKGRVTFWRDILLEAPGLLKIIGEAETGDDGSLGARLNAGITTDMVRVIPMARELLSAEEHDGYFWVPVHVGGTLSRPTEDLRPRLLTAIAAKASGLLREGIDAGLRILDLGPGSPAARESTNAVKALEKEAGSVLDAVGGFLK